MSKPKTVISFQDMMKSREPREVDIDIPPDDYQYPQARTYVQHIQVPLGPSPMMQMPRNMQIMQQVPVYDNQNNFEEDGFETRCSYGSDCEIVFIGEEFAD